MAKIVTFGEIMLRLAPYHYERLIQADRFQATYGGGEANVAVSLSAFGHTVYYVTRLPENPLGDAAENALRRFGVHTDFILRGGERLGIYFLEHGASIRPSRVVYDRAHSAVSELQPGMVPWEEVFAGKDWFHITGITPALSPSCAEVALESVRKAKELGLTVSCDLNYRKKLWTPEEAQRLMSRLVEFVDVVIGNEEDAEKVFGIREEGVNVEKGHLDIEKYKKVARRLAERSGAKRVAITLRESLSASDNNWSALFLDDSSFYVSRKYALHLVDRVGGGDSFAAGLIHGLVSGWEAQQALEFAVAASALKQTIPGDMNLVSEAEVMSIVRGNLSGRVQR